jgi:hypothetical protein
MGVKFEFALNENGSIINISDAIRGGVYKCLNSDCNSDMIPKMGINKLRAYHFAHKNLSFDHAGESELHYNTKYLVGTYLQNCISCDTPVYIENILKTLNSNEIYLGHINIMDGVSFVEIERHVSTEYRPDIVAFDENKNVKFVIEIINTHDLSNESKEYINENQIPIIKIYITDVIYEYLKRVCYIGNSIELWSNDKNYNFDNFNELKALETEYSNFKHNYSLYEIELKKLNEQRSKLYLNNDSLVSNISSIRGDIDKLNIHITKNRYELEDINSNKILLELKTESLKNQVIVGEKTKLELIERQKNIIMTMSDNIQLGRMPIICDIRPQAVICYFRTCSRCPNVTTVEKLL